MQYKMTGHLKVGNMNNNEIGDMSANIKFYETGSAPYYLNVNNTAKEFSNQELTKYLYL